MKFEPNQTSSTGAKRLIGVVVFVLFNIGYTPLYLLSILSIPLNMQSYDASGQGAPFKACHSDSACNGPNYFIVLVNILIVLFGFSLTAYLGAKAGKYKDFWRAFTLFVLADFLFCFLLLLTIF
jgi:hypothetical protein